MATLEVHDAAGRVQFIELVRDHPVLFGTSAACDVILEGDGIRPVHGRIRWKKSRYRVEASPDAEFVQLNGTKMAAGSLHEGDEIEVGTCRIFLLRNDDTIDVRQSTGAFDYEQTRVLAAPVVPVAPKNDTGGGPRPVLPRLKAPEAPAVAKDIGPGNLKGRTRKGAGAAESNDFVGPDVAVGGTAKGLSGLDRVAHAGNRRSPGTGTGTDPVVATRDRAGRRARTSGRNGVLVEGDHRLDRCDADIQSRCPAFRRWRLSHGDPRFRFIRGEQSRRWAHGEGTRAAGHGERASVYFDRGRLPGRRRWRHRGRCSNRSAMSKSFAMCGSIWPSC